MKMLATKSRHASEKRDFVDGLSFQRSSLETLWLDYKDVLQKTAKSRFRTVFNNSPELFRGYQLITGNFFPKRRTGIVVDTRNVGEVKKTIESCNCKFLCLSDNTSVDSFESAKEQINTSFDKVFPAKSSYEL